MPSECLIRRMTAEDLEQVWAIERDSFAHPWSLEDYRREVEENRVARYLVAEEDGAVLGFAGAWIIIDESHVTNVAVRADRRGQGIGRAVMSALLQYLSNLGAAYATLEVRESNTAAIALYKSLGFFAAGRRRRYYEDNGEDALIMVCDRMPEADPDFAEPETLHEN